MTFIASVIAKEGVAIIADSLVTTSKPVIGWNDFMNFLRAKNEALGGGEEEISFTQSEVVDLFKLTDSHTRNYEDKLFKLDKYTAITTTGIAVLNSKRMAKVISEFRDLKEWDNVPLEQKVAEFSAFLTVEIKSHLGSSNMDSLRFIMTHYDVNEEKTTCYNFFTGNMDATSLEIPDFPYVATIISHELYKVVTGGQNRISDKILLGNFLDKTKEILPQLISKVCDDLGFDKGKVTADYIKGFEFGEQFNDAILGDMEVFNISPLSLQQAVDLAWLLMRLETDFQKYTREIPTVGGVIKLATINKEGFKFISGHEVTLPTAL